VIKTSDDYRLQYYTGHRFIYCVIKGTHTHTHTHVYAYLLSNYENNQQDATICRLIHYSLSAVH